MSNKSRFRPDARRYNLAWAPDHDLHGLEVTVRSMRLGELESLSGMVGSYQDADDADQQMKLLGALIDRMGKVLVSWNRVDEDSIPEGGTDDDGELLPANAAGLRQLEDWEFMGIVDGYMATVGGASPDLGKGSSNGDLSPEGLPMTEE